MCMFTGACLYIYIYIYMHGRMCYYIGMHTWMQECMHICLHECVPTGMQTSMHARMHAYSHGDIYIYIYVYGYFRAVGHLKVAFKASRGINTRSVRAKKNLLFVFVFVLCCVCCLFLLSSAPCYSGSWFTRANHPRGLCSRGGLKPPNKQNRS